MAKFTHEQAQRWLAEQSALHCKSERQAQFLVKLSAGEYKTMLTNELKKFGFLRESNNG